jgi:hypothetical protein
MFDGKEVISEVSEGEHTGKWTCFTPVYEKYLHPNGAWKYEEVGYFETENEILDLLQRQEDDEDQCYYTDFIAGGANMY